VGSSCIVTAAVCGLLFVGFFFWFEQLFDENEWQKRMKSYAVPE